MHQRFPKMKASFTGPIPYTELREIGVLQSKAIAKRDPVLDLPGVESRLLTQRRPPSAFLMP